MWYLLIFVSVQCDVPGHCQSAILSNKTWHVVICVVYNKFEKLIRSHGDPEAHTWCDSPLLNFNILKTTNLKQT